MSIDYAELLALMKKLKRYASALDDDGFTHEASAIRGDILSVMMSDDFADVVDDDRKFGERFAIRGDVGWNEWLRSVTSSAGGGALAGALAGLAGGPAAPLTSGAGALALGAGGALYGAVSQPASDWLYRNTYGPITKARAQATDFVDLASQIAGRLKSMGAQAQAAQIQQIAQSLKTDVDSLYQRRLQQIRKEQGLLPSDASTWDRFKQSVSSPMRWWRARSKMRESFSDDDGMARIAYTGGRTTAGGDILGMAGEEAVSGVAWRGVGGLGVAAAGLGYMAGQPATGWAYDRVVDRIRGEMGQLKAMSHNLGRIAGEISKQLKDPRFTMYAQHIAQVLASVNPQMVAKMAQGYSTQRGK